MWQTTPARQSVSQNAAETVSDAMEETAEKLADASTTTVSEDTEA